MVDPSAALLPSLNCTSRLLVGRKRDTPAAAAQRAHRRLGMDRAHCCSSLRVLSSPHADWQSTHTHANRSCETPRQGRLLHVSRTAASWGRHSPTRRSRGVCGCSTAASSSTPLLLWLLLLFCGLSTRSPDGWVGALREPWLKERVRGWTCWRGNQGRGMLACCLLPARG